MMNPPVYFSASTSNEIDEATAGARDLYLAAVFISGSDINKFSSLVDTLEMTTLRCDKICYPRNVNKIYELLINWKNAPENIARTLKDNAYKVMSFLQSGTNTNNSMILRGGVPQFVQGAGSRGIGGRGDSMGDRGHNNKSQISNTTQCLPTNITCYNFREEGRTNHK